MSLVSHILLATDFSEAGEAAAARAGELARTFDTKLTVLHVHGPPPEPPEGYVSPEHLVWSSDLDAEAEAALEEMRSTQLVGVDWVVLATLEKGSAGPAICNYASEHNVDLIMMGSPSRSGVAHFFAGSVAEKVLRCANCSVLVVPNAEVATSF